MDDYYHSQATLRKPEPRKKTKARKIRVRTQDHAEIRAYVFARERNLCRCCRFRPAVSMHEIRPRSLGGRVSKVNSIAVCGLGTTGCHGYCQNHEIQIQGSPLWAEAELWFEPVTTRAQDWVHLGDRLRIESPVMQVMEDAC